MRAGVVTAAIGAVVSFACIDPASSVQWLVEFEYMRQGGTCQADTGPVMCEIRVLVRDDGTWSATGVPPPPAGGEIVAGAASELNSVFGQSWEVFTEQPFTGSCPTLVGGEEYGYVVREIPVGPGAEGMEPQVREVSSCTYDLERYDALVKRNQIETAWLAVKPPELNRVEFR